MGESKQHMDLVRLLKRVVEKLVEDNTKLVLVDLPEVDGKPPIILGGFKPDIYYKYKEVLIVGEAKTSIDFEKAHSIQQYYSFLQHCHDFTGKAIFILAIPWTEYISAKNMLRRIVKKHGYSFEIRVINNVNKEEIL